MKKTISERSLRRRLAKINRVVDAVDVVMLHLRRDKTGLRAELWNLHKKLFAESCDTHRELCARSRA